MIDFMQSTFGLYEPVGESGINFEYIGSVLIFCICLWGVFRIVTAMFRRK